MTRWGACAQPSCPRPRGHPQIVAHRGSSRDEPEHTLGAYRRAIDEGADALECDVRLTADGHLVCVHDRRVDRTSNGRGRGVDARAGRAGGLDFGVVEGRRTAARRRCPTATATATVLTLRRLLTTVIDCGRPVGLAIETKHPTRYAGLVERTLAKLLDRFGLDRTRRPDGRRRCG